MSLRSCVKQTWFNVLRLHRPRVGHVGDAKRTDAPSILMPSFAARAKGRYVEHCCSECGYTTPKYFGKCPACKELGTCKELKISATTGNGVSVVRPGGSQPQREWLQASKTVSSLSALQGRAAQHALVMQLEGLLGIEVGRVLGGGVRAGSLVLLGGGPGLGKSTLLLQVAGLLAKAPPWTPDPASALARASNSVLYVSGEESEDQIADRAARLKIRDEGRVDVLCASDMQCILEHLHSRRPKAAIIDSVQTLAMADVAGANGSVAQVRECAKALVAVCKQSLGIPIFLATHVTKGGDIAGPKTLEHIVDTTLYLEGEEGMPYRILRATKNRFGSTDEVGLLEMTLSGLQPAVDPAAFLERRSGARGAACATAVALEAGRPILVEVQALCSPAVKDMPPRRMVNGGLDFKRFDQVLAVLSKHGRMRLYDQDARVNLLGGLPAVEPAIDAAMAAAIISSFYEVAVPPTAAFVGEVDLAGQLRAVRGLDKRVAAAFQLGFQKVLGPVGTSAVAGLEMRSHVIECSHVHDLIHYIRSDHPN